MIKRLLSLTNNSFDPVLARKFLWGTGCLSLTYLFALTLAWLMPTDPSHTRKRLATPARILPSLKKIIPTPPPFVEKILKLQAGHTLSGLIAQLYCTENDKATLKQEITTHIRPKDLRAGQIFKLTYRNGTAGQAPHLTQIVIPRSFDSEIIVKRSTSGVFAAQLIKHLVENRPVIVEGTITSCFYDDALRQGMPKSMLHKVSNLLGYKFDLQRDIHPQDKFRVLFEEKINKATGKKGGENFLFVEVIVRGQCTRIYAYKRPAHDEIDFFDEKGGGVRSHFLRTPLANPRLTSRFGYRKHPVLGYTKLHRGIDFGAARGTPIMAAGDGQVVAARFTGGYGHYVRIRHAGGYETAYAHLSRYGKSIRIGTRVKQGRIIGYVGSTGRTTGPHLHFELIKKGTPINPKSVRMLPSVKLTGKELKLFQSRIKDINTLYTQSTPATTTKT